MQILTTDGVTVSDRFRATLASELMSAFARPPDLVSARSGASLSRLANVRSRRVDPPGHRNTGI